MTICCWVSTFGNGGELITGAGTGTDATGDTITGGGWMGAGAAGVATGSLNASWNVLKDTRKH